MVADQAKAEQALKDLVFTIESTGGVVTNQYGTVEPVGDRCWSDLADCYLTACVALGREPVFNPDPDAGDEGNF